MTGGLGGVSFFRTLVSAPFLVGQQIEPRCVGSVVARVPSVVGPPHDVVSVLPSRCIVGVSLTGSKVDLGRIQESVAQPTRNLPIGDDSMAILVRRVHAFAGG